MKKIIYHFILLAILFQLVSCGVYKQHIMFSVKETKFIDSLKREEKTLNNYIIQTNDYLFVSVFSNKGEIIIDPNNDLRNEIQEGFNNNTQRFKPRYLVKEDGMVKLPMIGDVSVVGYTLNQADSLLATYYSKYYNDPFVITEFANKRAIVFGPSGAQVIPLENEKISLVELLALYGGLTNDFKAHNIRLIRGDLENPSVQIIDLTTIEGMSKASLDIQPKDIVYVEPIRKPISEAIRDVSPILGIVSSVLALILVIQNR